MGQTTPAMSRSPRTEATGRVQVYPAPQHPPVSGRVQVYPAASARRAVHADDHDDEPEAIERNIERTRAEISATIDAIHEKLNPERIKEQVSDSVRGATIGRAEQIMNDASYTVKTTGNNILDTIRQNPIPAALVGIGLGWLLMKGSNPSAGPSRVYPPARNYQPQDRGYGREYRYYPVSRRQAVMSDVQQTASNLQDRASRTADQVQDRAQQLGSQVQDQAQQLTGQVQDQVQQLGSQVQDQAQQLGQQAQQLGNQLQEQVQDVGEQAQYQMNRAQYQLEDLIMDNPLAVGVIALALGAAAGLVVPSLPQEHQLMGEARDNLLEQAQATAQQTVEKVQAVAQEAASAATEAAQQEAKNQGLAPQEAQPQAQNQTKQSTSKM